MEWHGLAWGGDEVERVVEGGAFSMAFARAVAQALLAVRHGTYRPMQLRFASALRVAVEHCTAGDVAVRAAVRKLRIMNVLQASHAKPFLAGRGLRCFEAFVAIRNWPADEARLVGSSAAPGLAKWVEHPGNLGPFPGFWRAGRGSIPQVS